MPRRNLAWMLVVVVIALILWQLPPVIAARDTVIRHFGVLAEIRSQVLQRAVSPTEDQRLVRAAVRAGARAMIASLNDPYARYLDPDEYRRFRDQSDGRVGGIGVDVAVVNGEVTVQAVSPDTPAARADIHPQDQILEIDAQLVERIDVLEAINLLAGDPGSEVRLKVRSPFQPSRDLTLHRTAEQKNPVRGWSRRADGQWRYIADPSAKIGYMRLTEFLPNAVTEVDAAVAAMQRDEAAAWILDLRENGGGILDVAIELADRFVSDGRIVSTKGPTADLREWRAERNGTYAPLPMVVLVNGFSASCAEVLAGALRDNRRAVIVGQRTYGKGSVQELLPLKDGGAIKLTTRYYFLPSGVCIQKRPGTDEWGVRPDLPVTMSDAQRLRWLRHWIAASWLDVTPPPAKGATNADADDPKQRAAMFAMDPQLRAARDLLRRQLVPASSPRDAAASGTAP